MVKASLRAFLFALLVVAVASFVLYFSLVDRGFFIRSIDEDGEQAENVTSFGAESSDEDASEAGDAAAPPLTEESETDATAHAPSPQAPPAFRVDVVIPSHPSDQFGLPLVVEGLKRFVPHLGSIFVVAANSTPQVEIVARSSHVVLVREAEYPFSIDDVRAELSAFPWFASVKSRAGWYYQQLLKLYADAAIPQLSRAFLVLDSDSVFMRRFEHFFCLKRDLAAPAEASDVEACADWGVRFWPGVEYHFPYFSHMQRLLPGLHRVQPSLSGVSHHMPSRKDWLQELRKQVETGHNAPFWRVFLRSVDTNLGPPFSGASEYMKSISTMRSSSMRRRSKSQHPYACALAASPSSRSAPARATSSLYTRG